MTKQRVIRDRIENLVLHIGAMMKSEASMTPREKQPMFLCG